MELVELLGLMIFYENHYTRLRVFSAFYVLIFLIFF